METTKFRIREFKDRNYRAIYNKVSGETLRIAIDNTKEIMPLEYPELLDISFGTKCLANCPFCYTSAIKNGVNYPNLVEKINSIFGVMSENEKPFQVAIGGGGEPTLHPEFIPAMKAFYDLGITPNYTTNGMHLTEDVLEATRKYSGGVAVSCHPHLDKVWKKAVKTLTENNIRTNVHIIIGEPNSVNRFKQIYDEFNGIVEYFVLLPYQAVGRAQEVNTKKEFDLLFDGLPSNITNIAFGALFYEYILQNPDKTKKLNISIYEPETMSGYMMMDENPIIRKSSYDLQPKF